MASPQLVEYIERKLEENGVRGKVIPPNDELLGLTKMLYEQKMSEWVDDALDNLISGVKRQLADEFVNKSNLENAGQWIVEGFKENDCRSWREALNSKLHPLLYEEHDETLKDALWDQITDAVGRGDWDGRATNARHRKPIEILLTGAALGNSSRCYVLGLWGGKDL